MNGFSAMGNKVEWGPYGVWANSAAPRPSGMMVTVEAYCVRRWPRDVLTLKKQRKTMNKKNIARYRRTLEAARAQLMACDRDAGSFAINRRVGALGLEKVRADGG
jgi:hypothetical protein